MAEVQDRVYGLVQLDDPVLESLMDSAAMQRLQGVLQHGISGLIGITNDTSRFEHSVGAMLLVRRLGATLDEQIAALLHDVSHTAFSHVIDYVYHNHDDQSYHDEKKEEFVGRSDIPAILVSFGYEWPHFLDEERFPMLEQKAPSLCADRLDYFLRDSRDLGLATGDQVAWVLNHLIVHNGRIAVDDLGVARWLGYSFIAADDASWSNFREVGLYELMAMAIRHGLEIGLLEDSDIWGSDREAWQKLLEADDRELRRLLPLISPETEFIWDDFNPDFRISTKIRTIDPELLVDGELQPLSHIDTRFARFRESYLRGKRGQWPMRIVSQPSL